MDNKSKIAIIFPFVLAIILVLAAFHVPFTWKGSAAERQVLRFIPADLTIVRKVLPRIARGLKGPFNFSSTNIIRKTDNDELVRKIDYNDTTLSLIVMSGTNRMAVINGSLVKEGDWIDDMKVVTIERDRVLLKNKTQHWLNIGKMQ